MPSASDHRGTNRNRSVGILAQESGQPREETYELQRPRTSNFEPRRRQILRGSVASSTCSTGGQINGSSNAQNIARVHSYRGPETQLFLAASLSVSRIHFPTNHTLLESLPEISSPFSNFLRSPPPNHLLRAAHDRDRVGRGYGRRPGICIG